MCFSQENLLTASVCFFNKNQPDFYWLQNYWPCDLLFYCEFFHGVSGWLRDGPCKQCGLCYRHEFSHCDSYEYRTRIRDGGIIRELRPHLWHWEMVPILEYVGWQTWYVLRTGYLLSFILENLIYVRRTGTLWWSYQKRSVNYFDLQPFSLPPSLFRGLVQLQQILSIKKTNEAWNYVIETPTLSHIIIACSGINDIDASGEAALSILVDTVRGSDRHISFCRVKDEVMEVMENASAGRSWKREYLH